MELSFHEFQLIHNAPKLKLASTLFLGVILTVVVSLLLGFGWVPLPVPESTTALEGSWAILNNVGDPSLYLFSLVSYGALIVGVCLNLLTWEFFTVNRETELIRFMCESGRIDELKRHIIGSYAFGVVSLFVCALGWFMNWQDYASWWGFYMGLVLGLVVTMLTLALESYSLRSSVEYVLEDD